jgi:hypothetical protein
MYAAGSAIVGPLGEYPAEEMIFNVFHGFFFVINKMDVV